MDDLCKRLVDHLMKPFMMPKGYLSLAYSYMVPSYFMGPREESPVVDATLLTLLLILATRDQRDGSGQTRLSLLECRPSIAIDEPQDSLLLSVNQWCRFLADNSDKEPAWILLYYFLACDGKSFINRMLGQSKDFSIIITTGLRYLYEQFQGDTVTWEFVYTLLIVLLLLFEDDCFMDYSRAIVSIPRSSL